MDKPHKPTEAEKAEMFAILNQPNPDLESYILIEGNQPKSWFGDCNLCEPEPCQIKAGKGKIDDPIPSGKSCNCPPCIVCKQCEAEKVKPKRPWLRLSPEVKRPDVEGIRNKYHALALQWRQVGAYEAMRSKEKIVALCDYILALEGGGKDGLHRTK